MTRIFISHSSRDNFEALAFKQWLTLEGWTSADVFLDLHGIGAGDRWKEALKKANERCEAVILLLSPHSLQSNECYVEIRMAEDYGKVILPAILPPRVPEDRLPIDDPRLAIHRERQIVDASTDPREAGFTVDYDGQRKTIHFHRPTLDRIRARLGQLGISPTSFTWRPENLDEASPYPGFSGFTKSEAALFFGRAGDIARGFSELRRLRRNDLGQILLIQAASGAGKSSFLRAGLWPRLERDPEFVPIGIVRPATGIITGEHGLGRQLSEYFSAHGSRTSAADIHRALSDSETDAATAFIGYLNSASEIAHASQSLSDPSILPPTPILAVDQAEELFGSADAEESLRFLALVANALRQQRSPHVRPPIFIWTIRADSVDALLQATEQVGLKAPCSFLLPPIAREAYREIIEAPLDVANQAGMRLSIDPLLVDELVGASVGADALPMLSYTLRQLLANNRVRAAAALSLEQYESAGRIGGILARRLGSAQQRVHAKPDDLKQLFIPHLATWDIDSRPPGAKRLVASELELFSGERARLRSLADALVGERLLTRNAANVENGAKTLEVAHEALLRHPPLSDWLEVAREFLVWRDSVARARRGFEENSRPLLTGRELDVARDWLGGELYADVSQVDRSFVTASLEADARLRDEEAAKETRYLAALAESTQAREQAAILRESVAQENERAAEAALNMAEERVASALRSEALSRRARRLALGVISLLLSILLGTLWLTQETERREMSVYASLAARAYNDQHYERGMRYALLAYPPLGAAPWAPFSTDLEAKLAAGPMLSRLRGTFGGHVAPVRSVAFDNVGQRLLTSSDDGTARLWSLGANKLLAEFRGHTAQVISAAFTPDGTRVVTGAWDNKLRIWSASSGQLLHELTGHASHVNALAISADGSRIASASSDGTSRIWDANSGTLLWTLTMPQRDIASSVAFSPSGELVATASWDGVARLWNTATGTLITEFRGHTDRINVVDFNPDGSLLVTGSDDRTAIVWDVTQKSKKWQLSDHGGSVRSVAFNPLGTQLATGSDDQAARLWDIKSGKLLLVPLKGHSDTIWFVRYSNSGELLVTVSWDQVARLWNAGSGREIATLRSHTGKVLSAAFGRDDKFVVTASEDGTARIWDARPFREMVEFTGHRNSAIGGAGADDPLHPPTQATPSCPPAPALMHTANAASFAPDNQRLVSASTDGTARVWLASSGAEVLKLSGHRGWVLSANFSPDGTQVATASADCTARIWNAHTGTLLFILDKHTDRVNAVAFSPDGRWVATASADKTVRIWNAKSGEFIRSLIDHTGSVWDLSFSPDSQRIATASDDMTARISQVEDGRTLATFPHRREVNSVAFSPDGSRIVTGSDDQVVRIWDLAPQRLVVAMRGHSNWIRSVRFSPDGRRVASTSDDGTVRLWDSSSGGEMGSIRPHDAVINSVSFSTDGHRLVTTSDDGTARVLDVEWLSVFGTSLRERICEEILGKHQRLEDDDLIDPSLVRLADDQLNRNPCNRRGPAAWQYWQMLPQRMLGFFHRLTLLGTRSP